MKLIFSVLVAVLFFFKSIGQSPAEVTPEKEKEIRKDVEEKVIALKQQLEKERLNTDEIGFALDTCRIERFVDAYLEIDFSGFGMSVANNRAAYLYDSLMNKYYKKLAAVLKGDDKKVLLQAQKAWLAFRDSESKLVQAISKEEYTGGGTIQRMTEQSHYLDMIRGRTIEIFTHYMRIISGL